jgi:hypothetical protein
MLIQGIPNFSGYIKQSIFWGCYSLSPKICKVVAVIGYFSEVLFVFRL